MGDKRTTADRAIAHLSDGMTIGIGGWGSRRKPMALVRAILRSPLRELTVVSFAGPDLGMLCAAGKVKRAVFGFASLDSIPLEPYFRAARAGGRHRSQPRSTRACCSGACTRPRSGCLSFRRAPGLGSDALALNPWLRTVRSPYDDGEELVAMRALELDAALVHMNRADTAGNGQILGPDPYFDDLFCMAAKRRILSCERVVPTDALVAEGPLHNAAHPSRHGRRRRRGAARRGVHVVRARLRARRRGPERVRGERRRARRMGCVPAAQIRRRRGADERRLSRCTSCASSRAPRRGAATARSSPAPSACCRPSAARLARPTFAPDLLLTDGVRLARVRTGAVEGWMPYRRRLRPRLVRQASRDDGREPDRSLRQPEHLVRRRRTTGPRRSSSACAAHRATRSIIPRATGSPSTRRGSSCRRVDVVCGVGYDRAAALGRAGRFHEPPPRRHESRPCSTSRRRIARCACVSRASRRRGRTRSSRATGFELHGLDVVRRRARPSPRSCA